MKLQRLSEADLNHKSANFGGKYVEKHFKSGAPGDQSHVRHMTAFGYFMGWRKAESHWKQRWWHLFKKPESVTDTQLTYQSIDAAKYYIVNDNLRMINPQNVHLSKVCLAHGFRHGWRECEQQP